VLALLQLEDCTAAKLLRAYGMNYQEYRAMLSAEQVKGLPSNLMTAPSAPPASLAPDDSDNYHRWWNNSWRVVEPTGQGNAGDWTSQKQARLNELVRYAHQRGFWIRFYTLDGIPASDESCRGIFHSYNFGSRQAVEARWRAAARARVDYIATDQYEDLAQSLRAVALGSRARTLSNR